MTANSWIIIAVLLAIGVYLAVTIPLSKRGREKEISREEAFQVLMQRDGTSVAATISGFDATKMTVILIGCIFLFAIR